MFTGLIECVGNVVERRAGRGSARLVVESPLPEAEMRHGESIAVDGACLTVAAFGGGRFEADVVEETLTRTTLGSARAGKRVNLERSLRLGDRLGGHLVQGHVDAVAAVVSLTRRGDDVRLRLAAPSALRRYVASKGSVALNGVSLTVSRVAGSTFEVALIPATLAGTNLGALRAGSGVNVEVDLVARYLERLAAAGAGRQGRA